MSFSPYSGTSGGVNAFLLTPLTTADYTATPTAGTAVPLVNIQKWNVNRTVQSNKVRTFASPVTSSGLAAGVTVQGGTVDYQVEIEGVYDGDTATGADSDHRLVDGCQVQLSLLFHKNSNFGYHGVIGKIMGGSAGAAMGPDHATYRATIEVSGVLPLPTRPA